MKIPDDILQPVVFKDNYFDLKGLSAYSMISVSSLRYHIRESNLPCFKVTGKQGKTGRILVKRSEFDRWIESFRINHFMDIDKFTDKILRDMETQVSA